MRTTLKTAAAVVLLAAAASSYAQAYPTKPIRLIVPFAPGGTTEVVARAMAQRMGELLGQQVVVDTRPGASGSLGTALTAQATPDGYTLLFTSLSPIVINVALQKGKLGYDPLKDLTPISTVTKVPSVLTVHTDSKLRTVKDLIAFAKANPGKLSYGSSGTGSVNHLIVELFKSSAGIQMLHVPFKGAGQSVIALRSKEVDIVSAAPPAVLPHTRAGVFRGLAVSSAVRSPVLPETPTIAESGYPGFDLTAWYGLLGPAGMPRRTLDIVRTALVKTITTSPVSDRLLAEGAAPAPNTPEEFAQLIKGDLKRWATAVEIANVKE